jgi:hypothetical protein
VSLAVLSCESPFAPRGEGERVPLGEVIAHEVAGSAARLYSFVARAGRQYSVFLEATRGIVYLSVLDSVSGRPVATLSASTQSGSLAENATPGFASPDDAVHVVRVQSARADSSAQFRFMVYRVDTDPERRGSRFSIGDTVTGETIDPIVDVDDFLAGGVAGEEIVAVVDAQASPGPGALSLGILDLKTGAGLAGTSAISGVFPVSTTGRVRLPGTGLYLFRLRALGDHSRLRGPYRFWSYPINRAPERLPDVATAGTEISGEAIDPAGDVDQFTLQAAAGSEINAFLEAARNFRLEIVPPNGPTRAEVTAVPGSLAKHATGRIKLTGTGPYSARVSGSSATLAADTGAYRVVLQVIDRRPESVPAILVPGDTVTGEAIDAAGDIDEFTFSATAGQEFNVFFENLSGSPEVLHHLTVLGPNALVDVWSPWFHPDSRALVTGRFTVAEAGTYALRVEGAVDVTDRDVGPYQLCLYAIDRRPEHLPDALVFGDGLSGEAIDVPGDVDEFHVTVSDTSAANLAVRLGPDASDGGLEVQLTDSGTSKVVGAAGASGQDGVGQSGAFQVLPGAYTLRVQGGEARSRLRASYQVWLYRFRLGPEVAPDTIAVGDTISVEAIEPPGDEDHYSFYGTKGQHVNLALQGQAAESNGSLAAILSGPVPPYLNPLATVVSPTSAPSLADHQSLRLDLPATGWYGVTVRGGGWLATLNDHGAYRVTVAASSTAPERVTAYLAPGDSVTGELIDELGDWDEYAVTASPGQELGVVFQGLAAAGYVRVVAVDPVSGDSLAGVVGQGQQLAGPFNVPAGGRVTLAVFELRGAGYSYAYVGGYRLHVVPINRAPETVPAVFAVGDTVRGESIFPAGDIDEFTSAAAPGDTLDFWCRLAANPVPDGSLMTLQVVDPATEVVLVGRSVSLWQSLPTYTGLGRFVVPSSGTYLVRVVGRGILDDDVGTAPYEFFVTRAP